ncbi:MAG: DUF1329 domain-containing protein, partial [Gammaproteobacteria bacterium]|nr:DUF1329 domain-containing protein [Gammaproteobacteria bacterium]
MKRLAWLLGAASLCLLAGQAAAEVSAAKAAALGKTLTPVGAEKAGNKDGTIPAWTGGLAAKGSIHKPEWPADQYPDFVAQKPLFSIDHNNYQQYQDKLAAGQIELLKRYPDYKLNVYKTERTASFPSWFYKLTDWNATHCKLEGTDTPDGCRGGVLYPIPTDGAQIIWNHKLKWRGNAVRRYNEQAIVQPDGSYQLTKLREDVQFFIPNSEHRDYTLTPGNRDYLYYLSQTLAPPRLAGTFILVHERTGVGNQGRVAWLYSPGLRRIRRAPN